VNAAWDDARTAELYDEFTRNFPMYDETSRDLVRLADVADAARVVDLCCGTGATTRVVLEHVGAGAEIVAIDGSSAMLEVARRTIDDGRVRFVLADAAALGDHASDVDVIVCNSAIWQTDMAAVFEAAAHALRPGGRIAFNIGRQFIMLPFTPEELSRDKPSLFQYIQAIATLDHDFVAPLGRGRGRPLSEDTVKTALTHAGLTPTVFEIVGYATAVERDRAWMRIPIFANNLLDGMPYEQQVDVIEKAYLRVDKTITDTSRWAYFVAEREG
jgi:ubiquinone/menaquinone biosynthesis C-methylase UbiE